MIDRSEIERITNPRNLDDIRARYRGKETDMATGKIALKRVIAEELEAEALLGPVEVKLARDSYGALGIGSLGEYIDLAHGGRENLRDLRRQQRAEKVALSANHRNSPARQMALEMADELGVDRAMVGAEFDRLVEEGA